MKPLIILLLFLWLLLYGWLRLSPFPEFKEFRQREVSSRYYDRHGELLYIRPLKDGLRREQFSRLDEIDKETQTIFLKSEDRRFYWHWGVDLPALVRSVWQNYRYGRTVSGASTITMQLARIISPKSKTWQGKLSEAVNALRLESRLSKRQILLSYLNNVPFGFQTEGLASAARNFYGRPLSSLTTAQKLNLSLIPRYPQAYNPLTQQEKAIDKTYKLALTQHLALTKEVICYDLSQAKRFSYPQPDHFLLYVIGHSAGNKAEYRLSLDQAFNQYLRQQLNYYLRNQQDYRLNNGAFLVLDNKTGEILAYAGSKDFSDEKSRGQNDGVQVKNQPGSTLKPFLYAYGLEKGFGLQTVLPDIPLEFGHSEIYVPRNFNERYNGPVRYRVALASSLNIPAVYLLERLGVKNFTEQLTRLGFHSLEGQTNQGLALALGSAEVSLFELTRAFSVFANDGFLMKTSFIRQNHSSGKKRVLSSEASRLISAVLSDGDARRLGFGEGRSFQSSFPVIFKTGTSNQFQNIWALGATPRYTVGIWMGNFTTETIMSRTGSGLPAQLANDALKFLQQDQQKLTFKTPSQSKPLPVCSLSGMKAGPYCPSIVEEYISDRTYLESCSYHQPDGQVILPDEYRAFVQLFNRQEDVSESRGALHIVSPVNGAVFYYDPKIKEEHQSVPVEVRGGNPQELRLFMDDLELGPTEQPFRYYAPLRRGKHIIKVSNGLEYDEIKIIIK